MKSLTKKELERQDFVDNKVFELIQKLFPADKQLEWDIEMIGTVRNVIENELVKKRLISEREFYPYLRKSKSPNT